MTPSSREAPAPLEAMGMAEAGISGCRDGGQAQGRVAGCAAAPACATIPQHSKGAEGQRMRSETSAELLWWGRHGSPASALPRTCGTQPWDAGCPNGSCHRSRRMELKLLIHFQGCALKAEAHRDPKIHLSKAFCSKREAKLKIIPRVRATLPFVNGRNERWETHPQAGGREAQYFKLTTPICVLGAVPPSQQLLNHHQGCQSGANCKGFVWPG